MRRYVEVKELSLKNDKTTVELQIQEGDNEEKSAELQVIIQWLVWSEKYISRGSNRKHYLYLRALGTHHTT